MATTRAKVRGTTTDCHRFADTIPVDVPILRTPAKSHRKNTDHDEERETPSKRESVRAVDQDDVLPPVDSLYRLVQR